MHTAAALVVTSVLGALPRAAAACAVCTAGRDDETQAAFLWTTLFLSVLPLAMVGGLVVFFVRRARKLRDRESAEGANVGAVAAMAGLSRSSSSR